MKTQTTVKNPWEVAVYQFGHLRRREVFQSENAASVFAQAVNNDCRSLEYSDEMEGLTGKSVPVRWFGEEGHRIGGSLARPE